MRLSPRLEVRPGPLLLAHVGEDPGLAAHRARSGPLPTPPLDTLVRLAEAASVRGRGGAGFPQARKLTTVAAGRRRPVLVVNASEGEPASAKDEALLLSSPHEVLDGAVVAAAALGARQVHVVTPQDRPEVGAAVDRAIAERPERLRWERHAARPRFVSGQAQAVLELLAGRPNLPVTAWAPEAVSGHGGRPTLLSNAETYAHLGLLARTRGRAYAGLGSPEPGTTLLTVGGRLPDGSAGPGGATVVEVAHGTAFADLLDGMGAADVPVLVGGYHGTWAAPGVLPALPVSRSVLAEHDLALGAGVVVPLADGSCVVDRTSAIVDYLAGESAGRCGPCRRGLPALAGAVAGLTAGADTREEIAELTGLVRGRGACAHPDGTARLVGSMLASTAALVEDHLAGRCACARGRSAA